MGVAVGMQYDDRILPLVDQVVLAGMQFDRDWSTPRDHTLAVELEGLSVAMHDLGWRRRGPTAFATMLAVHRQHHEYHYTR